MCKKNFGASTWRVLWMDRPVPINVNLISKLTGLPIDGVKIEKYLDEKTKEKAITEEVKEKFATYRGSRGMIIKNINGLDTKFVTKLMACKLHRRCRKEEAPVGVVTATTQCAKGTILSWVLYLLNLFLEDCKDV
jgi:hypothetical protein